jgi:hypothetical protein
MDQTVIWTLIGVAALVVAAVIWFALRQLRTQELRKRFGPEYDRTVSLEGNARKAEAALAERAKRVEQLAIRPLSSEDAARFGAAWRHVQEQFVDNPGRAVSEADRLVGEVMTARGYPVGDFEQRVADISVDHPDVVMNYRAAREVALQHARGTASTEDLRVAMVHYRALFRDLLQTADEKHPERASAPESVAGRSH